MRRVVGFVWVFERRRNRKSRLRRLSDCFAVNVAVMGCLVTWRRDERAVGVVKGGGNLRACEVLLGLHCS